MKLLGIRERGLCNTTDCEIETCYENGVAGLEEDEDDELFTRKTASAAQRSARNRPGKRHSGAVRLNSSSQFVVILFISSQPTYATKVGIGYTRGSCN